MSVHKHPTHKGWYQVRYRPNGTKGKQKVITITKKMGGYETALKTDAELKTDTKGDERRIQTFPKVSETVPDYIKHYSLDHLDTTNISRHLKRWHDYVGRIQFNQITRDVVERFKHDRLNDDIKPITINKEIGALAGLVKWAARKGYCQKPDYFDYFPAKKTKSPLPDVPTRAEVLALINAMIWPKCGLFACLYYGGLRANEARMLRAEDVHLQDNYMIVTGKGNKQRPVAVVEDLYPWLEKRLKEVNSGYLWTTSKGKPISDLRQIIRWSCKRSGITRRMYPHLLRHAFGTHSIIDGIPMRALQYNMGHSTIKTTEIYTTLGQSAVMKEIIGKFGKSKK